MKARDVTQRLRQGWVLPILAGFLCLQGCGDSASVQGSNSTAVINAPSSGASATSGSASDVTIQVDARSTGSAVNRLVLGSNVQWVDGGDNLLSSGTVSFDPSMLNLVQTMAPTALRYPGGEQSDLYHWARGVGAAGARGTNLQAGTNQSQITLMGSGELADLGQRVAAEVLFTVNVLSGTASEAAAWVKQMNVTGLLDESGRQLPRVQYWEIGNEPYLPNPDGSNPGSCEIDPVTYAGRVNAFAQAMRAVDSSIKIGIALSNDKQNGVQVVSPGCPRFAATVLGALTEKIDFVSLHDAYLPYDFSGQDKPEKTVYLAAMASTLTLQADLAAMRAQLMEFPAFQAVPFAITEYNALFSLNPKSGYFYSNASPMGALYVADALRVFASRDDLLMANAWSLSGNDHWGAIHSPTGSAAPYGRPNYEVFRLFGEALQGQRIAAAVVAPTFDAPNVGFSASATDVPLVVALATTAASSLGNNAIRILVINKDFSAAHIASITVVGATATSVHLSLLTAANVFESDDLPNAMQRSESVLPAVASSTVSLPAHSIALVTINVTLPTT